ncbi:MAG: DUF4124 domain-containing protein [Cognaticolwellia sp.]
MNIKTLSLLSVIFVCFNASAAEKISVYRWVDENNVVHFSQQQPAHDNYIEMNMVSSSKPAEPIDNAKEKQSAQLQPNENNFVNNDEINDKCIAARKNIKTLQDFDKIKYEDENGKIKVLSALEQQQQLALNTKKAEVYCAD